MSTTPTSTPKLALADVSKHIQKAKVTAPVVLVGIRGYYRDSMGKPGVNDRGIYDDALFVVSPTHFSAWNANTDPSIYRPKTRDKQGISTLKPGVHIYTKGRHGISKPDGGYPAFRPANKDEALPVFRDGDPSQTSLGYQINIHRGGVNSTSSEGCQTVPPKQWDSFYAALSGELARHGQKTFPYVLVDAA